MDYSLQLNDCEGIMSTPEQRLPADQMPNPENLPYRQRVSGVLINKEKSVYVVQKHTFTDEQWDFPAGGIDAGESIEETCRREMSEELGVTDISGMYIARSVNRYEWPEETMARHFNKASEWFRGQETFIVVAEFVGTKDDIQLNEELRQGKWVRVDELPEHLLFDGQLEPYLEAIHEYDPTLISDD